ncbi:putative membrane protein YkvI [Sphingomonas naasensis]|uniref:Membrane protein YkvI n=1 Tax=Sphingomonas naasensis TaxID=1344951 RepID=A0A4S1WNE5_9SPHN|nr:hypothetical protein [Sphingomonas naasensis]NIJ21043.1 putative membrane protein YkvI [Sphingomonas naasensis]TGX43420.1 hypothetical protein E5A74_09700 [Sphingomonas naasensis]
MSGAVAGSRWFQRFLLPGFAMKAVIIGGGYATGRELAEYFLPAGPWGGLAGMLLAMCLWSVIAATTFAYARMVGALDYRAFFADLLGPAWVAFEIAYLIFVVLILAVFGASAGAIGAAMFGWPSFVGALLLGGGILATVSLGNAAVEGVFKYVSFLLYGVYALFLILSLATFGDRIATGFATPAPWDGWATGGLTYASYNIIGAVVILPVLRHLTSRRDAVIAGVIAGPLAMLPAILFFTCMIAFYPGIGAETLPSDFLLRQLNVPAFHWLFQIMIFAALLESGAGAVHAINERVAGVVRSRRGTELGARSRALIAAGLLLVCMFVAERVGLIALIASGYRFLAWLFLAVFVLPLLTIGLARLLRRRSAPSKEIVA